MPIHEVPHYSFGRLVGFEDATLYLLFPRLYRQEQQSSRLRDEDFQVWIDRVLLPAVYKHHKSSLVQHYPSSSNHAKYNSTARGVEARSVKVDNVPREQQLSYFIPPEHLGLIWQGGTEEFLHSKPLDSSLPRQQELHAQGEERSCMVAKLPSRVLSNDAFQLCGVAAATSKKHQTSSSRRLGHWRRRSVHAMGGGAGERHDPAF